MWTSICAAGALASSVALGVHVIKGKSSRAESSDSHDPTTEIDGTAPAVPISSPTGNLIKEASAGTSQGAESVEDLFELGSDYFTAPRRLVKHKTLEWQMPRKGNEKVALAQSQAQQKHVDILEKRVDDLECTVSVRDWSAKALTIRLQNRISDVKRLSGEVTAKHMRIVDLESDVKVEKDLCAKAERKSEEAGAEVAAKGMRITELESRLDAESHHKVQAERRADEKAERVKQLETDLKAEKEKAQRQAEASADRVRDLEHDLKVQKAQNVIEQETACAHARNLKVQQAGRRRDKRRLDKLAADRKTLQAQNAALKTQLADAKKALRRKIKVETCAPADVSIPAAEPVETTVTVEQGTQTDSHEPSSLAPADVSIPAVELSKATITVEQSTQTDDHKPSSLEERSAQASAPAAADCVIPAAVRSEAAAFRLHVLFVKAPYKLIRFQRKLWQSVTATKGKTSTKGNKLSTSNKVKAPSFQPAPSDQTETASFSLPGDQTQSADPSWSPSKYAQPPESLLAPNEINEAQVSQPVQAEEPSTALQVTPAKQTAPQACTPPSTSSFTSLRCPPSIWDDELDDEEPDYCKLIAEPERRMVEVARAGDPVVLAKPDEQEELVSSMKCLKIPRDVDMAGTDEAEQAPEQMDTTPAIDEDNPAHDHMDTTPTIDQSSVAAGLPAITPVPPAAANLEDEIMDLEELEEMFNNSDDHDMAVEGEEPAQDTAMSDVLAGSSLVPSVAIESIFPARETVQHYYNLPQTPATIVSQDDVTMQEPEIKIPGLIYPSTSSWEDARDAKAAYRSLVVAKPKPKSLADLIRTVTHDGRQSQPSSITQAASSFTAATASMPLASAITLQSVQTPAVPSSSMPIFGSINPQPAQPLTPPSTPPDAMNLVSTMQQPLGQDLLKTLLPARKDDTLVMGPRRIPAAIAHAQPATVPAAHQSASPQSVTDQLAAAVESAVQAINSRIANNADQAAAVEGAVKQTISQITSKPPQPDTNEDAARVELAVQIINSQIASSTAQQSEKKPETAHGLVKESTASQMPVPQPPDTNPDLHNYGTLRSDFLDTSPYVRTSSREHAQKMAVGHLKDSFAALDKEVNLGHEHYNNPWAEAERKVTWIAGVVCTGAQPQQPTWNRGDERDKFVDTLLVWSQPSQILGGLRAFLTKLHPCNSASCPAAEYCTGEDWNGKQLIRIVEHLCATLASLKMMREDDEFSG